MLALIDMVAEGTLPYSNLERFSRPPVAIDAYREFCVWVKAVSLDLGIGHLPLQEPTVYVSTTTEYILGIDVLQGLRLKTIVG